MTLTHLIPAAQDAHDAMQCMTQRQRIALAIQLVRDIDDPSCAPDLMRLGRLAGDVAHEIMKHQFGKECG